jgi:protein LSM14
VKDLRIEEAPAVKENKPPQVPNDPAILDVSLTFPLIPRASLPARLNGVRRHIGDEVFRM